MSSELDNPKISLDYKDQALIYYNNKNYNDALKHYKLSLNYCIKDLEMKSNLYNNCAACNVMLLNWEEVINNTSDSLNLKPNNIKALTRRANAYTEIKKYDEAIQDWKKILELDETNDIAKGTISRLESLKSGKPIGIPNANELASMNITDMLAALRTFEDAQARRKITKQVHGIRMALWRKDFRFNQGMARHLVEDVHGGFRQSFAQIVQYSTPKLVRVKDFKSVNGNLHHHHGNEDLAWFPSLRKRHPHLKKEIDILEKDHKYLVSLENRIVENSEYDALIEFVDALSDHLDREEMITIPYLMDGTGGF